MEITPEIIADFRATYPYFSDITKWPDSVVEDALCQGDAATQCAHWGAFSLDCSSKKRRGMYLYAAHYLTVMYPFGAGEGSEMSPYPRQKVSSKSVGDESISYEVAPVFNAGDEWLSSTQFGQMFLRLSRQFNVAFFG